MDPLRSHIAALIGEDVASMSPLTGGDVADSFRVELSTGRVLFAKTKRQAPEGFFTTEAAGLEWLRRSGTVAIPQVVGVSDSPPLLILEWIEPGRRIATTESGFGQALAALHGSGAPSFGREDRRSTGSRGLAQ